VLAYVACLLTQGWSQGATVRDAARRPLTHATDPRARAWDLRGALIRALADLACTPPVAHEAVEALFAAAEDRLPARGAACSLCPLVRFNDTSGRTRAEVLAVVEVARVHVGGEPRPRLSAEARTLPLPGLADG
jgi:hypothetical protein